MTDMVAFPMKDIGLLALCLYLLRQDLIRVLRSTTSSVPLGAAHIQQMQSGRLRMAISHAVNLSAQGRDRTGAKSASVLMSLIPVTK